MIEEEESFDEIIKVLQNKGLISHLSLKGLINFLNEFNLKPNKSQNIFPNSILDHSTAMYYKKCEQIYLKFGNFNKIVSLWSLNQEDLISLILELSKKKSPDEIETPDHYFSLELLISFAFSLHIEKKESNIEFLIGKMIGLYCKACYFNEIQIAHVVDQITILFPSFYLPKKDFATEKDQKDYFDKMVCFFHGILKEFSATVAGKIMKKILIPMKTPISKMLDVEYTYTKLIEEIFFDNLLHKMEFTTYERGLFLLEYDTMGYFREFLRTQDILYKYGFVYDNKVDLTEINSNISNLFKLQGMEGNDNLQRLLR